MACTAHSVMQKFLFKVYILCSPKFSLPPPTSYPTNLSVLWRIHTYIPEGVQTIMITTTTNSMSY
jgi:hypothetical protein